MPDGLRLRGRRRAELPLARCESPPVPARPGVMPVLVPVLTLPVEAAAGGKATTANVRGVPSGANDPDTVRGVDDTTRGVGNCAGNPDTAMCGGDGCCVCAVWACDE